MIRMRVDGIEDETFKAMIDRSEEKQDTLFPTSEFRRYFTRVSSNVPGEAARGAKREMNDVIQKPGTENKFVGPRTPDYRELVQRPRLLTINRRSSGRPVRKLNRTEE